MSPSKQSTNKGINVLKKILLFALLAASLWSAELPIANKYKIVIENGEFTVFEFPFKIKKTFSSGFLLANNAKEIEEMKKENTQIVVDPRNRGKRAVKKNKIIQIKQGQKTLTFLPKARGSFKIVVWGYKKYPLMFDITVVKKEKNKNMQYYYNFLDYSESQKKAESFETDPHEKVIVKLVRHIYNKKFPAGYNNVRKIKKFNDDVFDYTLNFSYIGRRYSVEEWLLQNKLNKKIKLYEELFLKEGVYAVAFENDLVGPGETVRMYIVRETTKGDRR